MKRFVSIIMITFFVSSIIFCFTNQSVKAQQKMWIVDDDGPADFSSIQAAVNAASENDTIHVREGTYNENITVHTALVIEGESRKSVVNGYFYLQNSYFFMEYWIKNFTILSGISVDCKNAPVYVYENTVYGGMSLGGYPADTSVEVVNNTIQGKGVKMGANLGAYICGNIFIDCPKAVSCDTGGFYAVNNTILNSDIVFNINFNLWCLIKDNYVEDCGVFINAIQDDVFAGSMEICQNTVKNCSLGFNFIDLYSFNDEELLTPIIYNNNFFGLSDIVYLSAFANVIWDNGYPIGGNYWSDYVTRYTNASEIDSSGIWDTPYVIDANNTDYYPLLEPIEIDSQSPTPTPSPTPTVTPSPTPTATPSPSPTATPSPTFSPTPSPTITPQPSPSPSPTPIPTPTPEVTPSPTPSPTANPTPLSISPPSITPTPIPTPSPTMTATPQPTATPTPTPQPSTTTTIDAQDYVFSLKSNSTITELAFNSTSKQLGFVASGEPETTGYVEVYIPKTLLSDVSQLTVYIDENQMSFSSESQNDTWLITLSYPHSQHTITLIVQENVAVSNSDNTQILMFVLLIAIIVVVALLAAVMLKKQKN